MKPELSVLVMLALAIVLLATASGTQAQAENDLVARFSEEGDYLAALKGELQKTPPDLYETIVQNYHEYRMKKAEVELYQTLGLGALGLVSLLISLSFMKDRPDFSSTSVVNLTGLVFIIVGTIMLVLMADTEAQLTAAMGILGAVAGYLFGTLRRREQPDSR